ncbi:hypothetical protein RPMA_12140 [Tardiphaga alba]|uniref:Uncharacterized protein n=1 Tax=Tardiphaga alba TaxID=340268 RepID=A0ABX8ACG1_9BRAD|nr:hypothetical protein [Tardiphaga alba]QUS39500.1 hypothetical protein RPMA_12140 [Tardiphaga alba]
MNAATSLDHLWRSASLPMWLALAAAAIVGLVVLVTILRAEKSVANGVLALITLLAIGVAAVIALRAPAAVERAAPAVAVAAPAQVANTLPALSCLDELAGEMVLAACEKSLFASPDTVAAAVAHAAVSLDRLKAHGDVKAADSAMTPELAALRRSVERDRYGLVAYVLQSRDRCMPEACAAYASLADHKQIASNMEERVYEGLVTRYAAVWNAAPAAAALTAIPGGATAAASVAASVAGLPASLPTGKPTNAEFPSSSSIPPISIMTDTPAPAQRSNAPAAPRPAAKKQAAPKETAPPAPRPQAAAPAAPVQLAPAAGQADN